jgi:hypothetical protein
MKSGYPRTEKWQNGYKICPENLARGKNRLDPISMEIPILIFTAKHLIAEDRQRLNSHVQAIALKSGSGEEDLQCALESLEKMKS